MFRNYLKVALRNLLRHRLTAFINIAGLSTGLAFCILTTLYVQSEWTADAFHVHSNQIYRVYFDQPGPSGISGQAEVAAPLGPTLAQDFNEIRQIVRFCDRELLVKVRERVFNEKVLFADENIFKMFTFPLKMGNESPERLSRDTVILSGKTAQKYFGNENPVGKTMTMRSPSKHRVHSFTVAGVVKTIPENSTIQFDILLAYENLETVFGWDLKDWYPFSPTTLYVQMADHSRSTEIETYFPEFARKHLPPFYFRNNRSPQIRFQPLVDIHLDGTISGPAREKVGQKAWSWILASISLLILLMACINYVNLSNARSARRLKEIGIRKVFGAVHSHVLKQFLSESVLLTLLALCASVLLADFFLPAFSAMVQKELHMANLYTGFSIWTCCGLFIFVTGFAGIYPALHFSRKHLVYTLKTSERFSGASCFSFSLLVFQFMLAISLMAGALVMINQVNLLKERKPGFNPESVLSISTTYLEQQNLTFLTAYKNKLAQYDNILAVSGGNWNMNQAPAGGNITNNEGENTRFDGYFIDYDFIETMELDLLEGRNFSTDFASDATSAVIVNESFLGEMGWVSPLGKLLPVQLSTQVVNPNTEDGIPVKNPRVIGVVKDYHFRSLHHKIAPLALFLNPWSNGSNIFVRISSGNIPATLEILRKAWRKLAPDAPFEFSFLDEAMDEQYRRESRWAEIIISASIFAVIIACMGILGMITLAANSRTKEIGIRKVLGASVSSIVSLLSKDFLKLVLLANILAWPLAWYAMDKWLQNFAYRVEIGWWVFAFAGGLALVIALLTVSTQAIRAALANPVQSLKYE